MVKELRGDLMRRLTPKTIKQIADAPKPTKVAEIVAVTKALDGMSVNLEEIAEVINIAEPGREIKAKADDYNADDIKNHPDLVVVGTPSSHFVRYAAKLSL